VIVMGCVRSFDAGVQVISRRMLEKLGKWTFRSWRRKWFHIMKNGFQ